NAISNIHKAKGAMLNDEIAIKGKAIGQAISIVGTLRSTLNFEQGGDLAERLDALYGDGAYGSLSYYPGYLLSGGIQDLISNFYAQSIYSNDDKISADFFVEAMDVLREYKEDVIEDIKVLVDHIAADDDVEIKLSY
ncbi:MAG TPA: flagellar protein FliS, partial [Gammaproteobacteria bacterium]|nr:flagellar protein FliS [Gammaproteobacteria bacterium]